MATVYKVLGQQNPAAATPTTLYTVPASNTAVISTLNICNLSSATGGTFRLAIRPAGASLANTHYLAYDTAVAASDSIALTLGVTLAATDVLTVYANNASMTFSAFGTEIY
jgi:hypothetical protein